MGFKVFAVVVTYKGSQWYERCFSSLNKSKVSINTIAVDNASADNTVDYLKQHFPDVHIIENKENVGFGRANNLGIKYALDHGADFVFLLNQDAWVEPDTMSQLIDIARSHPNYGILSPVHLNAEKNSIEKLLLKRLDDYRTTDSRLFDDLYFNRLKEIYDTKYVNAAAWLLPRKTIEMIGGFDPVFFHYGEDDNYINRVIYHGLKIGICPCVQVVHDNDRPRPLYDSREHEVLMLIEYTNVNKHHDIGKEMRQHRVKAMKGFLKGRKKAAKAHYADYLWLKKHQVAIETSVCINRNRGLNWL